MKFANWLRQDELQRIEAATDTGDIAMFARPIGWASQRMYPDPVIMPDPNSDEKKRKNNKKNM